MPEFTYYRLKSVDLSSLPLRSRLLSAAGGHALIVPQISFPEVENIYKKAKEYVGESEGKERVKWFMKFVHDYIEYDDNFGDGKKTVSLIQAIEEQRGVCKEKAAILQLILAMDGSLIQNT